MTAAQWATFLAERADKYKPMTLWGNDCRELAAVLRRMETKDALLRRIEVVLADAASFVDPYASSGQREIAEEAAATLAAIREQLEGKP